jgi:putative Ca2+/H+ antiporter (TMEM165/GDT1 family)
MELGVVITVYALIFVAELPDKTMIATLIMGSRYRPVLVWTGASLAFLIHATLAVAVGQLLQLLPHRWIEGITAVLFAAGAAYLLFVPEKEQEVAGEEEADKAGGGSGGGNGSEAGGGAGATGMRRPGLKTVGTAFAIIFIGEFGDLTQILTANLAAKYHQPASVFVGAFAALTTVAALGAFGGRALLRYLPLAVIRRVGGILLAGFAVYSLVNVVRG